MKIAVISDIHANTLALDSVLSDIFSKGCSKILCLGDLMLAGYDPNGVVEKLKSIKEKGEIALEIIQGNTDLMLTHPIKDGFDRIFAVAPCMAYSYKDDLKIIKKENINFINQFPTTKQLEIGGISIFMSHGSPRRVDENITSDMKEEEVLEIVKDVNADLILCGHTHIPCAFQLKTGQTLVNVGSVGRPMTVEKEACWVLVDINTETHEYVVEHQFTSYDCKLAAQKIRNRGLKENEVLAKMVEG